MPAAPSSARHRAPTAIDPQVSARFARRHLARFITAALQA
jgi:hypothetical protein